MSIKKTIAITGTKGKSTVTQLVDELLRLLGEKTLRVDTSGHYVNGDQKSTVKDSKAIWGITPAICPGRFLYEFYSGALKDTGGYAILECSLGSSTIRGTGYAYHNVGVFLNVLEDHLGSSKRLATRQDIANAKEFIFSSIHPEHGYAIYNADDPLVVEKLEKTPASCKKISCSTKTAADFAIKDKKIFHKNTQICDLTELAWAFNGDYEPIAINIMFAVASLYALLDGSLPENLPELLSKIRLDPYSGRLTPLIAKNGALIIADFAHEKYSLKAIGDLATKLAKSRGGKSIGIIRMAPDRTDEMIVEAGEVVAEAFDELIIYDKIDGHFRSPVKKLNSKFTEEVGRISKILSDAILRKNPNVKRIIREDEAIQEAAKTITGKDVLVVIVNDDARRSINFIKEYFDADFA